MRRTLRTLPPRGPRGGEGRSARDRGCVLGNRANPRANRRPLRSVGSSRGQEGATPYRAGRAAVETVPPERNTPHPAGTGGRRPRRGRTWTGPARPPSAACRPRSWPAPSPEDADCSVDPEVVRAVLADGGLVIQSSSWRAPAKPLATPSHRPATIPKSVIATGDVALGDGDPLAQAPSVTAAARHSKPAMQIGTSSRHPGRRTRDDSNVTDASLRMCFLLFMPRSTSPAMPWTMPFISPPSSFSVPDGRRLIAMLANGAGSVKRRLVLPEEALVSC